MGAVNDRSPVDKRIDIRPGGCGLEKKSSTALTEL